MTPTPRRLMPMYSSGRMVFGTKGNTTPSIQPTTDQISLPLVLSVLGDPTRLAIVAHLARRELAASLESPTAWVATGAFVAALHGLFFLVGYPIGRLQLPAFWEGGTASLAVAFAWLPPLLVGLAPALAMGTWAEERRSGTEELLLAWPVRTGEVVLGKFLAGWTVLSLLIVVALLPLALVVAGLGELDWSVTLTGLFGAILLGGACLSIGHLVSALAREQLVAFLIGALVLGALWSVSLAIGNLPPGAAAVAHLFSPAAHYLNGAAVGLLDLRDLLYFAALMCVSLRVTYLAVEARRAR